MEINLVYINKFWYSCPLIHYVAHPLCHVACVNQALAVKLCYNCTERNTKMLPVRFKVVSFWGQIKLDSCPSWFLLGGFSTPSILNLLHGLSSRDMLMRILTWLTALEWNGQVELAGSFIPLLLYLCDPVWFV